MKELDNKFEDFINIIDTIEHPILKEIAKDLLTEHKMELMNRAASPDRFENENYVAGGHHFFEGGLLCHLYGSTKMAIRIIEDVETMVDRDLVLFGAALHDIGKIYTYSKWDDTNELKCPSTIHAKMLQHSYLAMDMISKKFDKYDTLDSSIKEKALHIIASHMDDYEGGLVKPITIEAKIVRQAERSDCILSNYIYSEFMNKKKN